jgi:hypothetical protein
MKMSTLMTVLAVLAHADPLPPCSGGQVQVSNGAQQAASGHREIVLVFSLAPGAQECSLTGYPGVDSGATPKPPSTQSISPTRWTIRT